MTVFLGRVAVRRDDRPAPRAAWDLDGGRSDFPRGAGWHGRAGGRGTLRGDADLAGSVLRVPGSARIEGPGVSVEGRTSPGNGVEGKITMESTRSRLSPAKGPGRKG